MAEDVVLLPETYSTHTAQDVTRKVRQNNPYDLIIKSSKIYITVRVLARKNLKRGVVLRSKDILTMSKVFCLRKGGGALPPPPFSLFG